MNKEFIIYIVISSFATVGIMEFVKNFIKTQKKYWYAIMMIPISIFCFISCEFLPRYVIGCLLTIGVIQLAYQLIIQGFSKILESIINKISNKIGE